MEIVLRATAIYFFLWLITRSLGKRELVELTAFELLLLVVVGDLIQQGVTQEDTSVTGAVLAVATIAAWILLFSWVSYRWKPARELIEGVPVIVVRDGRPVDAAMRLERVSLESFLESARNNGIDDLAQVQLAILEPDGKFSFLTGSGTEAGDGTDHKF